MSRHSEDSTASTVPPALVQGRPDVDVQALVAYRRQRLRQEMRRADVAMTLLTSPVSLRYVADFRDYALFQSHIPIFYAFIDLDGPVVIHGARGQSSGTGYRARLARGISAFNAGARLGDEARLLANDVRLFLGSSVGERTRIAVEYANPSVIQALMQAGFDVVDAVNLVDQARSVKCAEELTCMRWSIEVAEAGMRRMRDVLAPGVTENQLWAVLAATNIAQDGDWCDGRMLCSGSRTNPWLQEASSRVIRAGELVAFDTDMIGPFGYCADISRTWLCGEGRPSDSQRELYQRAYDEVHSNMALIRAGMSFSEISESGFRQPDKFIPNRYSCLAHGVGMSDEWPKVFYQQDWMEKGYHGVLEENMVLCVESYVGAQDGTEGVKLEEQVLVAPHGYERLSRYPFEQDFL